MPKTPPKAKNCPECHFEPENDHGLTCSRYGSPDHLWDAKTKAAAKKVADALEENESPKAKTEECFKKDGFAVCYCDKCRPILEPLPALEKIQIPVSDWEHIVNLLIDHITRLEEKL